MGQGGLWTPIPMLSLTGHEILDRLPFSAPQFPSMLNKEFFEDISIK